MAHEKWGDIVEDELGSIPSTTRTLSGVLQEVRKILGPAAVSKLPNRVALPASCQHAHPVHFVMGSSKPALAVCAHAVSMEEAASWPGSFKFGPRCIHR